MGELVQLRRHYEVIFVQALDLLRLQRDVAYPQPKLMSGW
jgi:hypothetical protein